jgi:hypothetical protein
MPVLEGLLQEPHNGVVLDLIFEAALLHGLDKLRMHTETTLDYADKHTLEYSRCRRTFKTATCAAFDTYELPKETEARGRRLQRKQAQSKVSTPAIACVPIDEVLAPSDRDLDAPPPTKKVRSEARTAKKKKEFNMNTYKYHSIGDYPDVIRHKGTTDNWTTQIVRVPFWQNRLY